MPRDPERADLTLEQIAALDALTKLTDDDRETVIGFYCHGCGTMQPWHPDAPPKLRERCGCQCQNDE